MDTEVKYQYRTDFFREEDWDMSNTIHTHLKGILNNEGAMGWRVVSTWSGEKQLPFSNPPVIERGMYVLYERRYTGELPK